MRIWIALAAVLFLAHTSSASIFFIDNGPPVVNITSPTTVNPFYGSENQTVRIEFNYFESTGRNYTIIIFNSTMVVCNFDRFPDSVIGTGTVPWMLPASFFDIVPRELNDSCTLVGARNNNVYSLRLNMSDWWFSWGSNTQVNSVILDSVPPVVSGEIPLNNSEVAASLVTLSVNTSEVTECRYAQTSGASFGGMTVFANTNATEHSVVLGLTEFGTYRFYIRCRDYAGNMNDDYYTTFYYTGTTPYFGRSVSMNFGMRIGANKSDDVIRRTGTYAISYDELNGTAFGVVYSGSVPFSTFENSTYNANDYLLTLTQSSEKNRFIIAYTKGDDSTIRNKADLGDMKIPAKTFYSYAETEPGLFSVFVILQYTNLHITGSGGGSGLGNLMIRNNGNSDDGLKNITVETT